MRTRPATRTPHARTAAALAGPLLALALACGESEAPPAPAPTPPAAPAESAPAAPAAKAPEPAAKAPAADGGATAASGGDAAAGKVVYENFCVACHGITGGGDGPVAAGLDPRPAAHNDAAYMDTLTDAHIFQVIKEGGASVGKSPLMAPWGGTLSDAQIRDVVAYIRTLAK